MRRLKDHQEVDAVRTMEELGEKFRTGMAIINHVVAQFGEQGRPVHLRQGEMIQQQWIQECADYSEEVGCDFWGRKRSSRARSNGRAEESEGDDHSAA